MVSWHRYLPIWESFFCVISKALRRPIEI